MRPGHLAFASAVVMLVMSSTPARAEQPATRPARTEPVTGKLLEVRDETITVRPQTPAGQEQREAKVFRMNERTRVHKAVPQDDARTEGGTRTQTLVPEPAKKSDLKAGQTVLVRANGDLATSVMILPEPEAKE